MLWFLFLKQKMGSFSVDNIIASIMIFGLLFLKQRIVRFSVDNIIANIILVVVLSAAGKE